MISFKPIDQENFEACCSLKLAQAQKEYLASNAYSLIEAYAYRNSVEKHFTHAVYNDDQMIGFIMYHYSPFIEGDEDYDEPVFYISRMMIDVDHQGNGYGEEALKKLIDMMKSYKDDPVEAVVLSCDIENEIAYELFEKYHFKFLGEVDDDGDHILRLPF